MRISEIMTEPVQTAEATMPVNQAAGLMRGLRIHHLIIKEGAKVVGLLSARDLPRGGATVAWCGMS
jgi:signal-transduction protein with cAMP-binding, CBS, and nucleotidyltransferase domain